MLGRRFGFHCHEARLEWPLLSQQLPRIVTVCSHGAGVGHLKGSFYRIHHLEVVCPVAGG
jgi:hypothetical protein